MNRLSRFLSKIVISAQSIFQNQRMRVESKQEEVNRDLPRQKANNSIHIPRKEKEIKKTRTNAKTV